MFRRSWKLRLGSLKEEKVENDRGGSEIEGEKETQEETRRSNVARKEFYGIPNFFF